MKRFKFRLQRVLEFRHTLTKEKERELANRTFELRTVEQNVADILREQDEADSPETAVLTMAELQARGEYYDALQQALVRERENVLAAAEAVEQARLAYVEKAVEEETLEKLKEKKRILHNEELHRNERKELDSLVTQRFRLTAKSQ